MENVLTHSMHHAYQNMNIYVQDEGKRKRLTNWKYEANNKKRKAERKKRESRTETRFVFLVGPSVLSSFIISSAAMGQRLRRISLLISRPNTHYFIRKWLLWISAQQIRVRMLIATAVTFLIFFFSLSFPCSGIWFASFTCAGACSEICYLFNVFLRRNWMMTCGQQECARVCVC